MLKLNAEQFFGYLPIFIMETRDNLSAPAVVYNYIIGNKALHKFINSEMIEVWNETVEWDKEREGILQQILWDVPSDSDYTRDLEDWLTTEGILSYKWETDNEVYVELDSEEFEDEFLKYCTEHFTYKQGTPTCYREFSYGIKIEETETDTIKELGLLV